MFIVTNLYQCCILGTVGRYPVEGSLNLNMSGNTSNYDILVFCLTARPQGAFNAVARPSLIDVPLAMVIKPNQRPTVADFDMNSAKVWIVNFTGLYVTVSTPLQMGLSESNVIDLEVALDRNDELSLTIFGTNNEDTNTTIYVGFLPAFSLDQGSSEITSSSLEWFCYEAQGVQSSLCDDPQINITMETFSAVCVYWNETREAWRSDGCQVRSPTTGLAPVTFHLFTSKQAVVKPGSLE